MTCFNVASISQDVIDLTFNRVLSCLVISCHFISTPLMFQNTQYEERARGASISPSYSVSLSSRSGVGQMGEIKKRAVMRKIAFRFSACSTCSEGEAGRQDDRHSHNVVEKFEFSSRRPSISLIQAMPFNMGLV